MSATATATTEDVQGERLRAENEKLARQNRDMQDKVIATTENDLQLGFRFATSKALQDEFSSEAAYLAYMHDQAKVAQGPAFQRRLAAERS